MAASAGSVDQHEVWLLILLAADHHQILRLDPSLPHLTHDIGQPGRTVDQEQVGFVLQKDRCHREKVAERPAGLMSRDDPAFVPRHDSAGKER